MKHIWIMLVTLWTTATAYADNRATETIGALLCLSGDCASWGQSSLNGVMLAVEELNATGGIGGLTVVVQTEDSRESSPAQAITGFRALSSNSSIRLIIGPTWTPAGAALAPIASRSSMLVITPSIAVADFSSAAANIFNTMPVEDIMTEALAEFAISRHWRRFGIFASQHPAELSQAKVFEAKLKSLGGEVTFFADPPPTAEDLRTEALRISSSKPDAVFISNWWGAAPKALRAVGYDGPILTRQMDADRLAAAGTALHKAYFPRYPRASDDFVMRYQKKYKQSPPLYAATAYDAVGVYAALRRDPTLNNAADLAAALSRVNYHGASGVIRFANDRTIIARTVEIAQVNGDSLDGPAVVSLNNADHRQHPARHGMADSDKD